MEVHKDMLFYYVMTSNVCLRRSCTCYHGLTAVNVEKHISEHRVVHDFGLCAMVKTAQAGDLNARANVVSELVACQQHQRELLQCHKMCLPDLQFLYGIQYGGNIQLYQVASWHPAMVV